jgi:hypothetical protein
MPVTGMFLITNTRERESAKRRGRRGGGSSFSNGLLLCTVSSNGAVYCVLCSCGALWDCVIVILLHCVVAGSALCAVPHRVYCVAHTAHCYALRAVSRVLCSVYCVLCCALCASVSCTVQYVLLTVLCAVRFTHTVIGDTVCVTDSECRAPTTRTRWPVVPEP